jgi:hypothetical protein
VLGYCAAAAWATEKVVGCHHLEAGLALTLPCFDREKVLQADLFDRHSLRVDRGLRGLLLSSLFALPETVTQPRRARRAEHVAPSAALRSLTGLPLLLTCCGQQSNQQLSLGADQAGPSCCLRWLLERYSLGTNKLQHSRSALQAWCASGGG